MNPPRLAVLLSGSGRTLQNLIDRQFSIGVVVSNVADAYGLVRAAQAGIPAVVVERKCYADRNAYSEAIFNHCRAANADLVCLAGFLQLLRIPDDFCGRVLNVHPSLLPAFGGKGMYGRRVHEAVLKAGCKVSGCTVHVADDTYDTGPILVQKAVDVLDDDTIDTLAERVFRAECEAYPEAIRIQFDKLK